MRTSRPAPRNSGWIRLTRMFELTVVWWPVNSTTTLLANSTSSCPPAARFWVNPRDESLERVLLSVGPLPKWVKKVLFPANQWAMNSKRLSVKANAWRETSSNSVWYSRLWSRAGPVTTRRDSPRRGYRVFREESQDRDDGRSVLDGTQLATLDRLRYSGIASVPCASPRDPAVDAYAAPEPPVSWQGLLGY